MSGSLSAEAIIKIIHRKGHVKIFWDRDNLRNGGHKIIGKLSIVRYNVSKSR